MKKVLSFLLIASMIGSLVGCGVVDASPSQEQTDQEVQKQEEQVQNKETKVEEKKSLEERKQEAKEKKKQALMEKYGVTLEDDGFYYNNEVEKLIPVEADMESQIKRLIFNDKDYLEAVMLFGVTQEMFDILRVLVDDNYVDMTDSQGSKLLLIEDYDTYQSAYEFGIPKELADKLDSKTYEEWFDAKLNGI